MHHLVTACIGILAVACALTPPTAAQTVRATVSVDSVRVGERFTLSLVATHRSASTATFPPAEADTDVFGDVEALERTPVATRHPESRDQAVRVDSVAYEVTTFALDTAHVPALSVRFVAGTDTVRAASAPLHVPVQSTLPADPQGLRGLAPLAAFSSPRWPWILLGAVALALIAGLAYYWRRRQTASKEAAPPAPEPSVPPYEAAQQRLQSLEETTDWDDPEALERFFVALSTTVRTYVARRLGVAALERTTRELVGTLHAEPELPAPAVDAIQEVLEQADLVKFADARPTGHAARTALRKARTAIDDLEHTPRLRGMAANEEEEVASPPTRPGTKSASDR